MADVLSKYQRKFCMSRIRGKNTKPELLLRKALWSRKLRYRLKNSLPGRPDIIFPGRQLAVFVDGCFWHGCQRCKKKLPATNRLYWARKIKRNIAKSRAVKRSLLRNKWSAVRIWEHEIKKDGLIKAKKRVQRALKRK